MIRVADFGISKINEEEVISPAYLEKIKLLDIKGNITLNHLTSRAYLSPEVLKSMTGNTKIDMWALGVLIYELIKGGDHPFKRDN